VTQRRSPKRTYKGTDTRLYGADGDRVTSSDTGVDDLVYLKQKASEHGIPNSDWTSPEDAYAELWMVQLEAEADLKKMSVTFESVYGNPSSLTLIENELLGNALKGGQLQFTVSDLRTKYSIDIKTLQDRSFAVAVSISRFWGTSTQYFTVNDTDMSRAHKLITRATLASTFRDKYMRDDTQRTGPNNQFRNGPFVRTVLRPDE
jgi:hypothetical protein